MTPHKHAEVIKAWADGAVIEYLDNNYGWHISFHPFWETNVEYRVKPTPKPDTVHSYYTDRDELRGPLTYSKSNLKLIYDGETGELKAAEVIK